MMFYGWFDTKNGSLILCMHDHYHGMFYDTWWVETSVSTGVIASLTWSQDPEIGLRTSLTFKQRTQLGHMALSEKNISPIPMVSPMASLP
jgi:hypothetical protein